MQNQLEITPDILRQWLEEKQPVRIIDIRPKHDYEDWHIATAENVAVYNAIAMRRPGELETFENPGNAPVVTVCYSGNTSKIAAHYLNSRGIQSYSLAGGMQWWSLAWNQAAIPLESDGVDVIQIRRTGKGCLSYMIGSKDEAAVIDPSVDVHVYLDIAEKNGWKIKYVLESHIHADHLTRGRVLAAKTGAKYLLPPQQRAKFEFQEIQDGQELLVGTSKIKAIHTPGHTNESTSYLLDNLAIFTGDTLFANGIGRPDLESANKKETQEHAALLYQSLLAITEMPDHLVVLGGHTSEPVNFDEQPVSNPLQTVKENLKQQTSQPEKDFVGAIVKRLPPTPPQHLHIINFNEQGIFPEGDVTALEAGPNRCAV